MTITGNPVEQLELAQKRAEIAEAESLRLRAALAQSVDQTERARRWAIALEQNIAEASRRLELAHDDLELFDFELYDAIQFLRNEVRAC